MAFLHRALIELSPKRHTLLTVGNEVYTPTNGRGGGHIRVPNPLESMVKGADFGVVGRAKIPDPVRIHGSDRSERRRE